MSNKSAIVVGICGLTIAAVAGVKYAYDLPVSTGSYLNPVGNQVNVGSFPLNLALSPDSKFIVVSDVGFRQQLTVLDGSTGATLSTMPFNKEHGSDKESLYLGVAFGPDGKLYVSRGGEDIVSVFTLLPSGQLSKEQDIPVGSGHKDEPNFLAGLAISSDGKTLNVVGNETYWHRSDKGFSERPGSLHVVDIESGKETANIPTGGFPYDVVTTHSGKSFVSSERDGEIFALLPDGTKTPIRVGANPTNLRLSHSQDRLYVSNSGSDTVSVIDTDSNTVVNTFLVRPAEARGLPGTTPLGIELSHDDKTLYVACADLNAVAVLDASNGGIKGYIPVGWYPTSVALSGDGQHLFVANAKGVQSRTPNGKNIKKGSHYIEDLLEGTVSMVDPNADLSELTRVVLRSNRLTDQPASTVTNPGIKHVVYIIKENRTYDNTMGDLPQGNGDKSLCLFPRSVTPNQHALAERFVLLDNFFACSEVSADGWNWSTAGMANPYVERNTVVSYAGRGRDYDFEGQSNGLPNELYGTPDISAPAGGYIWDSAVKSGVSYRNYGFFVSSNPANSEIPFDSQASKKALQATTDRDFREFDMAYPDSDAWVKLNFRAPKQLLKFGSKGSPSRFSEWNREFDAFVRNHNLPALTLLRLPRDHTQGTAKGHSTPSAMVADNDYAVGEVVDKISHSIYWKDTAICILEDDAQAGRDHVDCHRIPALIISPYTRTGVVNSHFWNTDSMLKTIEVLLGLPAMCHYDGFAEPIDVFTASPVNSTPYSAIMPRREILASVNLPTAYRAKDSEQILSRFNEESGSDLELNDILWGAVHGWKGSD